MAVEHVNRIATDKIQHWLKEMYDVSAEITVLQAMWATLSGGPRNANDVSALDHLNARLRTLRKERATLRKLIHEEPEFKEPI